MTEVLWKVGVEQRRPYDYQSLEVFTFKRDALEWAETYAQGHGGVVLSTNRWRLPDDSTLLVWRDRS